MHVDLDAFYASVEQLRRPELRGKPVIVGGSGAPGERGVVAAASYEARPFGVRSAMPLSRARRLCPNAIFVPCDFDAYREASKSVFAILDHYSPVIEPIALDEAYLDLTGEDALLGPPGAVALRLRDEVKAACGLDLSIGVASCKLVAKVASELRKPRGLVVVPTGGEAAFLAPLPLGRLPGCGPATAIHCWANSSATTAACSAPMPGVSIQPRSCRPVTRKASRARSPLTATCGTPAKSGRPRSACCRTSATACGRTG